MKLYFDTETCNLITEEDLKREYPLWLLERASEDGIDYVKKNFEYFTYEVFEENCTNLDGTLLPVENSGEFVKKGVI